MFHKDKAPGKMTFKGPVCDGTFYQLFSFLFLTITKNRSLRFELEQPLKPQRASV